MKVDVCSTKGFLRPPSFGCRGFASFVVLHYFPSLILIIDKKIRKAFSCFPRIEFSETQISPEKRFS